jgi:hypothetical protein
MWLGLDVSSVSGLETTDCHTVNEASRATFKKDRERLARSGSEEAWAAHQYCFYNISSKLAVSSGSNTEAADCHALNEGSRLKQATIDTANTDFSYHGVPKCFTDCRDSAAINIHLSPLSPISFTTPHQQHFPFHMPLAFLCPLYFHTDWQATSLATAMAQAESSLSETHVDSSDAVCLHVPVTDTLAKQRQAGMMEGQDKYPLLSRC